MPDIRNDEPINSVLNDLFGFSFQASVIAKLVGGKDSQNHLSVGVSGSWGSGKTSLLYMVRELLEYRNLMEEKEKHKKSMNSIWVPEYQKDLLNKRIKQIEDFEAFIKNKKSIFDDLPNVLSKPVKVIWFDPWFFGSEETVIKAFFYRIAKELVDEDRELSKLFLKLAVVMVGSPNLPESSSLPVVGDAFKIINFGRNLINRMSGDDGSIMDFTDIKRKICERLKTNQFTYVDDEDDTKKKTRKRIVVIIDDLDRLQVSEALTMLKVIRLVTEFGVNFVIGYDEETLSATIDKNCGGHGREYIRKMINVPLKINIIDKYDILKLITFHLWDETLSNILINELSMLDHNEIFSVVSEIVTTIRMAKNIINIYKTGYPVMKDFVDPIDYLGLCLIFIFYPKCYKAIKDLTNLSDYHLFVHDFSTLGVNGRDMRYELLLLQKHIFENFNETHQDLILDRNDYLSRILSEMFFIENTENMEINNLINITKDGLLPILRKITFLDNHKYYFSIISDLTKIEILPNMLP